MNLSPLLPFGKTLGRSALTAAALMTGAVAAEPGSLASLTLTLHHNSGEALEEGLIPSRMVNLAGDVVTELRDCAGNVRKRITGNAADAIVLTQSFDARGNLIAVRDATGAGTDYTYDALNRRILETDAKIPGKVVSMAYDRMNRMISRTDAAGVTTTFEYDLRDRLVKESTPMNANETRVIRYGYDGRGQLTSLTDANGAVTTWTYDNAGRQTGKTYANGDHRSMEYDAAGRLVKLTDENGDLITSTYNLVGELTSKHYSKDNSTDTFAYDAASRIVSATKGRYGHTLTYTYDNAGRLATETHPDGAVTSFAYDLANRLATLTHTPAGGGAPTQTTLYGFDGRGLLATVSAGDYATRYEYRVNGQLASTIDFRATSPQADILRTDRSYDVGARLLGVANTAANGDQAGVVYTLGNDDQRLTATEETGARWNYTYDQLKQLTGARKTDTNAATIPPLDQSYGFDPMGNRSLYTEQGRTVAYTKNNANQYTALATTENGQLKTENLAYDHNGNLLSDGVRAYTWDADNQLTSVTPLNPAEGARKVSFTYDWRGRRTAKEVATFFAGIWHAAGSTDFKYHEWNLIAESSVDLTTPASPLTTTKSYVWGNDLSGNLHSAGGVGGLLSMAIIPSGVTAPDTYFHAFDGNGNVRALVKADAGNPAASAITARYAYDGFGKEVAVSGVDADKNAFRFSTKQLDAETGMNYYGYRFYAADAGRWINRDRVMERGGLNVYGMIGNQAISRWDVLGLCPAGLPCANSSPTKPKSKTPGRKIINGVEMCRTNKQKSGYTPKANGCGAEGGAKVPDNPFSQVSFATACNAHDICFGTCGSNRDECNLNFLKGMLNSCMEWAKANPEEAAKINPDYNKPIDSNPLLGACSKPEYANTNACVCLNFAVVYYSAVVIANGDFMQNLLDDTPYQSAQDAACEWECCKK